LPQLQDTEEEGREGVLEENHELEPIISVLEGDLLE